MHQDEVWADIAGYEGWYQVSNWGRVRSLDRISAGKKYKGRILKLTMSKGTLTVTMYIAGDKYKRQVSRMVYEAFIGSIPDGMYVIYKDNNSKNCRPENLDLQHASIFGIENNPNDLDRIGIDIIALEYADNFCSVLAKKHNTNINAIYRFLQRYGIDKKKARELKAEVS